MTGSQQTFFDHISYHFKDSNVPLDCAIIYVNKCMQLFFLLILQSQESFIIEGKITLKQILHQ